MQNRNRSRSPLQLYPTMQQEANFNPDCVYLFVSNLPKNWFVSRIKQFLHNRSKSSGLLQSLKYITLLKNDKRKCSGECVMEFTSAHACAIAMKAIRGAEVEGKTIIAMPDTGAILGKSNIENNSDRNTSISGGQHTTLNPETATFGLSVKFLESLNIKPPLRSKIYIDNLDRKVTESGLRELFSHAGQVITVQLQQKGDAKMNAKIEFDHPVEAVQAISMFNDRVYFDNHMVVKMDMYPNKKQILPPGLANMGPGLGPNGEPLRGIRHVVELEPIKQMLLQELSKIQALQVKEFVQDAQETGQVASQVDPTTSLMSGNYQNTVAGMNNALNVVGQSIPGIGLLGQMQTLGLLQPSLGYATTITDLQAQMTPNITQSFMGVAHNQLNLPQNQLNYMQNQINIPENQINVPESQINVPQTQLNGTQSQMNAAHCQINAAQTLIAPPQNQLNVLQNQMNSPQNQANVSLTHLPTSQLANLSQNRLFDLSKSQITKGLSAEAQNEWSTKYPAQSKTASQLKEKKDYDDSESRHSESSKYIKDTVSRRSGSGTRKSEERNALTSSDMLVFQNLPPSVTAKALTSKMSEVGELRYVDITAEGRAIVRFNEVRDAARCIRLFDRSKVDGQTISVNYF